MSFIIACLGSENDYSYVESVIKNFENAILISDELNADKYEPKIDETKTKISLVVLNSKFSSDVLVNELTNILKTKFSQGKMLDLDIAVNIISGPGIFHTALISSIIKLGYGIRIVDLDSQEKIIEV